MIAVAVAVELLRFQPQSARTAQLFDALIAAAPRAGVELSDVRTYGGSADWLMLWGPGAPNRFEAMRAQVANGGHVICWDLSYWDRDRKLRVSIDAAHPHSWVMRKSWPSTRLQADGVRMANRWNPNGPIVVAGLGDKARIQYGADVVDRWEQSVIYDAMVRTSRPIWYRHKRPSNAPLPLVSIAAPTGPIESVLEGASAVITYHSNVAVDAIRLGIPVICCNGAAAAVCASRWPETGAPQPLPEDVRDRFMSNLAWFQWSPSEARECWEFLRELLS